MHPSKAISLLQPWAWLAAVGLKSLETRSWSTSFRGPLAIHASLGRRGAIRTLCEQDPFIRAALDAAGLSFDTLPRGGIIGAVELTDVLKMWDGFPQPLPAPATGLLKLSDALQLSEQQRAFGEYAPGRFAWRLNEARALPELIACPGALQLWTMPAEVAAQLSHQLSH